MQCVNTIVSTIDGLRTTIYSNGGVETTNGWIFYHDSFSLKDIAKVGSDIDDNIFAPFNLDW